MREGKEATDLVVPALSRVPDNCLATFFREHLTIAHVNRAELHHSTATHAQANFRTRRDSGITWLAMTGLGVDKIMRRAGHDMVQTTMGYVKQAEDLTGDLGAPFAPLPDELIEGRVASVDHSIGPIGGNAADPLYRRRDSNPHVLSYGGF